MWRGDHYDSAVAPAIAYDLVTEVNDLRAIVPQRLLYRSTLLVYSRPPLVPLVVARRAVDATEARSGIRRGAYDPQRRLAKRVVTPMSGRPHEGLVGTVLGDRPEGSRVPVRAGLALAVGMGRRRERAEASARDSSRAAAAGRRVSV